MAELIDVKMMSKPKGSTTSKGGGGKNYSYVTTSQQADTARYAKTAGKAEKADLAEKANYSDQSGMSDRATYADTAGRAETLTEFSEVWDKFLRKDQEDTARELITFLKGLRSKHYKDNDGNENNLLGSGFELVMQENGKSRLEVDELLVRMAAYFFKLDIREFSYLGGDYIFSGAGSTIMEVMDVGDSWKCYLMSNDGTTATENHWEVNDQARCKTFDVKDGVTMKSKSKNYWRLVTATGEEPISGKLNADGSIDSTRYAYVTLSKHDCSGDSMPERGDKIVQMGNRTDASRQGVVYIRTQGVGAILIYTGIGASYPYYSLDHVTLQLSPEGNIIRGKLYSTANGDDGESIDDMIDDLRKRLDAVSAQTDQKMDIWMYGHAPLPTKDNQSESNLPASDWTTTQQMALHVQDIFYDTSRQAASRGGRTWRWVEANGVYYWEEVTDQDTIAALEKIADVASDGVLSAGTEKTRVLADWLRAVSEYRQQSGAIGTYLQADYGSNLNSTWNTYILALKSLGTLLNNGVTYDMNTLGTPSWLQDLTVDTTIDSPDGYRKAWNDYYEAQAKLIQAVANADKTRMDNLGEDSKLTPSEKLTLLREWENILAERSSLQTQADNARVSRAAYDSAFGNIAVMLCKGSTWGGGTPTLVDSEHIGLTSDINFAQWSKAWATFYMERTALLTAISASKVSVFVYNEPIPPYKVGDLWIRTDGQNVMTCVQGRRAGENFSATDWKDLGELTTIVDPRLQLAALAEKLWKLEKALILTSSTVHVYFGTTPSVAVEGDVKYISGKCSLYQAGKWNATGNTEFTTMLSGLATVLGTDTIKLCYVGRNGALPSNPKKWDMTLRNVTFYDSFKKQTVEGNIEVLMWNGDAWELLREGTTAVLENLGNQLRAIVFGGAGTDSVDASGLITRSDIARLFSEHVDYDPETGTVKNKTTSGFVTTSTAASLFSKYINENGDKIASAFVKTFVTKTEDGYMESGIKIKGDQINLEGAITANGNFGIDIYGNMTASNATISGAVTATSGRVGGFRIEGNSLTNKDDNGEFNNDASVIFRNDTHDCFAGIGGNVLPASSGVRAVARFENHDTDDWWGIGRNYAMVVSARGGNQNIAIDIGGGSITRLAYCTQIIGFKQYTQSVAPTDPLLENIKPSTVALYVTTQHFWRDKAMENGKEVEFQTRTYDVYCSMPDMFEYDDGHTIKIKRGKNNGNCVYLIPGKSHYSTIELVNGEYQNVSHEGKTCFLVDTGTYITGWLPIRSEMDAMELVFFRDIVVTINNEKYHGVWVEFKHPREW